MSIDLPLESMTLADKLEVMELREEIRGNTPS